MYSYCVFEYNIRVAVAFGCKLMYLTGRTLSSLVIPTSIWLLHHPVLKYRRAFRHLTDQVPGRLIEAWFILEFPFELTTISLG